MSTHAQKADKCKSARRPSYSQMQISTNAQEAISFIPTLYQTVQAAGLSTTPAITCCDATGWPKQTTYTAALVAAGMQKYLGVCLLYTSPSPRDRQKSRMPSS